MALPSMHDFRDPLPRLTELHDRFVADETNNFFRRFPRRLRDENSVTFRFYKRIEDWLSFIPKSQWVIFQGKVGAAVSLLDLKHKRYWEKLHDVFNEALGAKILRQNFRCQDIVFVPPTGKSEVPDLRGTKESRPHYLEVKTINHSLDERLSWYGGKDPVHTTELPLTLIQKIKSSYAKAITQLTAPVDSANAVKIVLFVLNPDHNVDPIEEELDQLFMDFFSSIENPEFPIHFCILTL
ncbi:MAG TPA: hypothetical protein VGM64_13275 [Lacunisphaera sp.]|jgi:hypothetical protein